MSAVPRLVAAISYKSDDLIAARRRAACPVVDAVLCDPGAAFTGLDHRRSIVGGKLDLGTRVGWVAKSEKSGAKDRFDDQPLANVLRMSLA